MQMNISLGHDLVKYINTSGAFLGNVTIFTASTGINKKNNTPLYSTMTVSTDKMT